MALVKWILPRNDCLLTAQCKNLEVVYALRLDQWQRLAWEFLWSLASPLRTPAGLAMHGNPFCVTQFPQSPCAGTNPEWTLVCVIFLMKNFMVLTPPCMITAMLIASRIPLVL